MPHKEAIKTLQYELETAESNFKGIKQNIEMNEEHVNKMYVRLFDLKVQIKSHKYAIEALENLK